MYTEIHAPLPSMGSGGGCCSGCNSGMLVDTLWRNLAWVTVIARVLRHSTHHHRYLTPVMMVADCAHIPL